jgi:alginate O-acetyltransferase complex protein AlgI
VDFLNGLFIERFRSRRIAILGVYSTLLFNLGLLVIFKYGAFILGNINTVADTKLWLPTFALPLGISFYTFQTISYTLDVYRGEVRAQRSFLKFLLFVANFHHLVAGPIVRYGHVAPELEVRPFDIGVFSSGVSRFCTGLFKKVFIANVAGELSVNFLDGDLQKATFAGAWFGLSMFAIQIYFDFSGYSDMAIGSGRMFGFFYRENFDHPYVSTSITEFWRRWHISLGSFFRDYVYIPLGGNRHHPVRNIFVVWVLTGIWHGASWNFAIWGLYFGLLLALEKYVFGAVLNRLPRLIRHVYAMFFVLIGWAIFYFVDFSRLYGFIKILFDLTDAPLGDFEVWSAIKMNVFWLTGAVIFCTPLHSSVRRVVEKRLPAAASGVQEVSMNLMFLVTSVVLLVDSSYNPFIYFRF